MTIPKTYDGKTTPAPAPKPFVSTRMCPVMSRPDPSPIVGAPGKGGVPCQGPACAWWTEMSNSETGQITYAGCGQNLGGLQMISIGQVLGAIANGVNVSEKMKLAREEDAGQTPPVAADPTVPRQ